MIAATLAATVANVTLATSAVDVQGSASKLNFGCVAEGVNVFLSTHSFDG